MTSKNFGEIFQLTKDDFLSTGILCKSYVHEYYSSYSTMNSLTFASFRALSFLLFFSNQKNKLPDLSSIH